MWEELYFNKNGANHRKNYGCAIRRWAWFRSSLPFHLQQQLPHEQFYNAQQLQCKYSIFHATSRTRTTRPMEQWWRVLCNPDVLQGKISRKKLIIFSGGQILCQNRVFELRSSQSLNFQGCYTLKKTLHEKYSSHRSRENLGFVKKWTFHDKKKCSILTTIHQFSHKTDCCILYPDSLLYFSSTLLIFSH